MKKCDPWMEKCHPWMEVSSMDAIHGWHPWMKTTDDGHGRSLYHNTAFFQKNDKPTLRETWTWRYIKGRRYEFTSATKVASLFLMTLIRILSAFFSKTKVLAFRIIFADTTAFCEISNIMDNLIITIGIILIVYFFTFSCNMNTDIRVWLTWFLI